MALHVVLILVTFSLFWILLDSTSAAQEISIKPTSSVGQSSPNSQTLESSTKSKTKTVIFEHDGIERQEFTAYANFLNATDVFFVARHPTDKCLDADARMNKIVFDFGGLNCSTTMMWGKSGFFWGQGDSEVMSHIPSGSKDVHVSLSNKNVYLVGENKAEATEIFICAVKKTITSIGLLFEKGAYTTLAKDCKMTLVLDDNGFLDPDDIPVLSTTLPTTSTVQIILQSTGPTSVISNYSGPSTTRKTRTTVTTTTRKARTTTTGTTRATRPTRMKSTEATTAMTTPRTTVIIATTDINTTKNGTPNAHIPTKKAPSFPIFPVEPTTENGAGVYRPWAVIHIGLLLLITALY